MKRKFIVLALILSLLCTVGFPAFATERITPAQCLGQIAEFDNASSDEEWANALLPERLKSGTGEWYVLALCGIGGYDLSACADAIEDYLSASPSLPAVSEQKYALALLAAGRSAHPFIARVHAENGNKQGVMSLIWGLILDGALPEGKQDATLAASLLSDLLSLQGQEGGWALQPGRASDPDVTAMALQALAFHKDAAKDAIENALACLQSLQKASGGFVSYGVENAESVAQVILALCALGIDPEQAQGFVSVNDALLSFAHIDGGFAHTKDGERSEMATAQSLLALVACRRLKNSLPMLFDLSAAAYEPEPQTEQSTSNAQTEVPETDRESESESEKALPSGTESGSLRPLLICILLSLAVTATLILILKKRANRGNLLLVAIITLICLIAVLLIDIRTPSQYFGSDEIGDGSGSVTLTVRDDEGTVLLSETAVTLSEGDTVYHALVKACRLRGLTFDMTGSSLIPETVYIRGIGSLYEFDRGPLSGWTFSVNGTKPNLGCGLVKLKDGDYVEWCFVKELDSLFAEET